MSIIRLNDNGRHPNPLIYFIKDLVDLGLKNHASSSTSDESRDEKRMLERLAAFVYPIMKANGLIVKCLQEHEWNPEFLGRNFNNGELVELVLRGRNGSLLPIHFVLSVLLHELSHCTNMHHAAPFWATLGLYKKHSQDLLGKGYTGEGFWSRGVALVASSSTTNQHPLLPQESDLPLHLCAGAYKRRRRARSTKSVKMVTANGNGLKGRFKSAGVGVKLPEQEAITQRSLLESSCTKSKAKAKAKAKANKPLPKPRVAQSKRGVNLRLNAALARASAFSSSKQDTLTSQDLKFKAEEEVEEEEGDVVYIGEFEMGDFVKIDEDDEPFPDHLNPKKRRGILEELELDHQLLAGNGNIIEVIVIDSD